MFQALSSRSTCPNCPVSPFAPLRSQVKAMHGSGLLAVLEGVGLDGSGGGVNIGSLGPAPLCPGLATSSLLQVLQPTTWCSPGLEALSEQPSHPAWSLEGTAACYAGLPLPALA